MTTKFRAMIALSFLLLALFAANTLADGTLTLPASLISIEDEAFSNTDSVDKIVIPYGTETIGSKAFADSSVKEIWIPSTVKVNRIAEDAFDGCDDVILMLMSYPDGIARGGKDGFWYSPSHHWLSQGVASRLNLTYLVVNDGVLLDSGIYRDDFILPSSIRAIIHINGTGGVYIPDGVTIDKNNAFQSSGFRKIRLPDTLTKIERGLFGVCSNLESISIPENVTEIESNAFWACKALTEVHLPNNLVSIGSNVFYQCYALPSIDIPQSVTEIGDAAFSQCYSLTHIAIPKNTTVINPTTFAYCTSLTDVCLPEGLISIGKRAFRSCTSLFSIYLPDSITSIDEEAFQDSALETVYAQPNSYAWYWAIANGYTVKAPIDAGYFEYSLADGECSITGYTGSAAEVLIPSKIDDCLVTAVNDGAFQNHTAITSVYIQAPVAHIGANAFYGCSNLSELTLPGTITQIGSNAFYGCDGLETVRYNGSVESWLGIDYGNYASHPNSYCGNILFSGEQIETLKVPDSVEVIPSYAFSNFESIHAVKLAKGVKRIESDAFSGCANLSELILPDTVSYIASGAFSNAGIFTVYTNKNTYGHYWAFGNDIAVEHTNAPFQFKYTLSDGQCQITGYADEDLLSETEIIIPATVNGCAVTGIGNGAFRSVNHFLMTSISIPTTVVTIGGVAFANCNNLTSINLPSGLTSIGEGAFTSCYNLTSIDLPSSLTSIGEGAFGFCSRLESISIPNGVKTIENNTFSYCVSLKHIDLPAGLTQIGEDAFDGSALESITIPETVSFIGDYAFLNCTNLETIDVRSNNAYYTSKDGVLFSKDMSVLFVCPAGKSGDYVVPNGVTTIAEGAFVTCEKLTSISIPQGIVSIGQSAFDRCRNATTINISPGITAIEHNTFYNCASMTGFTVPDGVITIKSSAFQSCGKLKSIFIPESVTDIGRDAFIYCSAELTVYGKSGSYAQTWSSDKGYTFVAL